MKYAVISCSHCRKAWTVETRHKAASCPRCATPNTLVERRRLWAGDDPGQAGPALAAHNGAPDLQALERNRARDLPHESDVLAAASQATGIVNRSEKAEAVARWLSRTAPARHEDLVASLQAAGLDPGRAESEIVRMLATDVMLEPRPGRYRMVA